MRMIIRWADCQLTWYGITLYGTIDAGFGWQSHGAPFDPRTPTRPRPRRRRPALRQAHSAPKTCTGLWDFIETNDSSVLDSRVTL
jgi:hypothetical protein